MPLVKNTETGNNYLVKINTDGDACSRTAIRSYSKQLGSDGFNGNTTFYLPWAYEPGSHTLWVFVNGEKAVVEQFPSNTDQYEETTTKSVSFGASLQDTDILEFIVAGSYLSQSDESLGGSGLTWIYDNEVSTTVVDGYGYLADTTSNAMTFILPASPEEGESFAVADAFGNFGTNNATLDRNGNNINGLAENFIFNKDGQAATFVFDGIDNWTIVSDTGFATSGNDWLYVDTDRTAAVDDRYFVDTSVGGGTVITITAPLNPSPNDTFVVSDYAGTFYTDNCVIDRNGSNIMGIAEDHEIDVDWITVRFTYFDATQGWKIVTISS